MQSKTNGIRPPGLEGDLPRPFAMRYSGVSGCGWIRKRWLMWFVFSSRENFYAVICLRVAGGVGSSFISNRSVQARGEQFLDKPYVRATGHGETQCSAIIFSVSCVHFPGVAPIFGEATRNVGVLKLVLSGIRKVRHLNAQLELRAEQAGAEATARAEAFQRESLNQAEQVRESFCRDDLRMSRRTLSFYFSRALSTRPFLRLFVSHEGVRCRGCRGRSEDLPSLDHRQNGFSGDFRRVSPVPPVGDFLDSTTLDRSSRRTDGGVTRAGEGPCCKASGREDLDAPRVHGAASVCETGEGVALDRSNALEPTSTALGFVPGMPPRVDGPTNGNQETKERPSAKRKTRNLLH